MNKKYSAKQKDAVLEYIKTHSKIESKIEHEDIFQLLKAEGLVERFYVKGPAGEHCFLTDKGTRFYNEEGSQQ